MVLIDTSVWILALKKNPVLPIKKRVETLLREEDVVTIGMIKLELLGGVKSEGEFHRLKSRLDALYEIDIDYSLWEEAAWVAFRLRRAGITVPYTDILIASAAIKVGGLFIHADIHFDLIAKHTKLKAENLLSLLEER